MMNKTKKLKNSRKEMSREYEVYIKKEREKYGRVVVTPYAIINLPY